MVHPGFCLLLRPGLNLRLPARRVALWTGGRRVDVCGRPPMVARALKIQALKIEVRRFERRNLKRVLEIERASFGRDAWPAEAFLVYWRHSPELFLTVRHGRRIAGYSITQVDWRGADL